MVIVNRIQFLFVVHKILKEHLNNIDRLFFFKYLVDRI